MTIRLATCADIDGLCALLEQLFAQEAEFTADRQAQSRGLRLIIEQPVVGEILLAEVDGRIVAMVNLLYSISTALGTPVALLEDMVVDASQRGSGLGSDLLQAAIAHAHTRGCRRITLLTDGDNLAGQRFYARQGFTPSSMLPMRLTLADK